ncbi:diguanylate cyclase [Thermodesulfobacterium sp. TA1]|uniref:sensor domain-containing diguanylate cyclase n=1 Tax=Thermodesulfobacterium sp. TA1 TaxID=2234087 RepID=UPI001231F7B4|nr:diguanylate cyclase [Thermodesulfobacterium sp. TA1]QER41824.1 diguanylate cyclase [Thermodesulfobacterium sp. TA1]
MRLKHKILLWLFTQLILFFGLSWFIYLLFVQKSFFKIEKEWVFSIASEVIKYLEVEKKRSELLTRDWAVWDDAYDFLTGKMPNFPKSNLNRETYVNNKLSVIAYLFLDGKVKAGGFYDKKADQILPVDPVWLKEHYRYYRSLYPEITLQSFYTGLSFYQGVPSIVSFYPVTDSEAKKTPVGLLVMVFPLEGEKLDLIKDIFGLINIDFITFQGKKIENTIKLNEKGIYEILISLRDFFGNPLGLSFTVSKKIAFEKYLEKFLLVQFLVLMMVFGVFYFHMRLILKKIEYVKSEIDLISKGKKEKITLKGEDELVELVKRFNLVYSLLKTQLEEVNKATKIYQMIAERSNLAVAVFNQDEKLVYANSFWKNFIEENLEKSIFSFIDREGLEKTKPFKLCFKTKTGEEVCLSFEVIPIKEYSLYYLVIGYDISYLKEEMDQLFVRATKDQLTGLYNRTYLEDIIKRIFDLIKRGQEYSVIFVDVDYLKDINDQFGHLTGDRYLKAVAEVIAKNSRAEDIPVRWGGDEFILIIRSDLEGAKKVAERILQGVKEICLKVNGNEIKGSVSIGVAKIEPDKSLEELIFKVDQALYQAKSEGKGKIKVIV